MNHLKIENVLNSYTPDVIFSNDFQKEHPGLQQSFTDYFHDNYKLVKQVREVTHSTNRVSFNLYLNKKNNDIRIVRQESGCFHSEEKFVSLAFIQSEINVIEENQKIFLAKYAKKNEVVATEYFNVMAQSLKNVFLAYEEFKHPVTIEVVKAKI